MRLRPLLAPSAADARDAIARVDRAVRTWLGAYAAADRVAVAVSGGRDSMVLLHAASRGAAAMRSAAPNIVVLTFDHGTGPAATRAAALVVAEARLLGLAVVSERRAVRPATEAAWRTARWAFLREASRGAPIATAHTRDDQVETVLMRVLRDAGARGLAGLAAPAPGVDRPLLRVSRDDVAAYAASYRVPHVEDPTNVSRAHLRNRVRHDLLPALARVRPEFGDELLALADEASVCRATLERLTRRFVLEGGTGRRLRVAREELATYDSATLCVLWPAIAARAHVTLDRRGTLRLAQFTTAGAPGGRIQLSGGVEVFRHRDTFVIQPVPATAEARTLPLTATVRLGPWRFRVVPASGTESRHGALSDRVGDARQPASPNGLWVSDLPADRPLFVRAWQPTDRMRVSDTQPARRVKRFFGDADVPGPSRTGWPVVLVDEEIVWIPGVRRGRAASVRSGRPMVRYACERLDDAASNG